MSPRSPRKSNRYNMSQSLYSPVAYSGGSGFSHRPPREISAGSDFGDTYVRLDDGVDFDTSTATRLRRQVGDACRGLLRSLTSTLITLLERFGFRTADGCSESNVVLAALSLGLALATVLERVILKVASDRVRVDDDGRDYRYVLAQVIVLFHLPITALQLAYYAYHNPKTAAEGCNFPKWKLFVMALLEALQTLIIVVTCGAVPATLTVLMLQSSLPLTLLVSSVIQRLRFHWRHWVGAIAVTVGLYVAAHPIFFAMDSDVPSSCSAHWDDCISSVALYAGAGFFAAGSVVAKDAMLGAHTTPLAAPLLNTWVLPLQFVCAAVLAAPGRHLQHPSRPWGNFSAEFDGMGDNIVDGIACIVGGETRGWNIDYGTTPVDRTICQGVVGLTIGMVLSGAALSSILIAMLRRGAPEACIHAATTIGFVVAWSIMAVYQSDWVPSGPAFSPKDADNGVGIFGGMGFGLVFFGKVAVTSGISL